MADIKKASIYYRNNILYKINDEFVKLTGYTYGKVIGKTLEELSEILKAKIGNSFRNGHLLYKGYIFTNKDEPKYVEITCEDSYKKDEKIYSFKESSNEFLKGLLATCIDNPEDKSEAIAIYSYPDLIHLKVNKNYMDKQKLFRLKYTELIGSVYNPTNPNISGDIEEKGYFYEVEKELIDKEGNAKYWTIKSNLIYEEGEAKYLKNTFIEETEKVLTRKALENKKLEMEIILDNIPDSIVKLNSKGEYTYKNKSIINNIDHFNSNYKPLNDKDVFKLFKYNDVDGHELSFEETPNARVLKGEILTDCIVIKTDHLSTMYLKCNRTPIYDEKGNIEGAVLIYKDIGETIRLEEYNVLAKNIKDIDINYATISYSDSNIKYINNNAFKLFKKIHPDINSKIEVIGKNFFDYYTDDSRTKEKIINNIKLCVQTNSPKYVHKQKFIEEGKVKYIKTIFQPIFDQNNNVEKISSIGMYITDEELANHRMAKSLKIQEEIFINTSHELKTPINLIFSASQLLNVYTEGNNIELKNEKMKNTNKIIAQNCYRTIKLINNILDISTMEGGFYELNLENNNIVNIVDDIISSVLDYIKNKNLIIIFDPKIEEKIIAIDAHRFEKVMLNLLSNAIKFSKDSGIIFVDLIEKENFIEISVKDQGIGIHEKNIKHIFNKFKQENKSLNRQAEGTGVGLSLASSIVKLHEGTIAVESTVGIGSKFTIKLPCKIVDKPINTKSEYSIDDRIEMIKFEFSDIYS